MENNVIRIKHVYCLSVSNLEDFLQVFGTRDRNFYKGAFQILAELEMLISNKITPEKDVKIPYSFDDGEILWQYKHTMVDDFYIQHVYEYMGFT